MSLLAARRSAPESLRRAQEQLAALIKQQEEQRRQAERIVEQYQRAAAGHYALEDLELGSASVLLPISALRLSSQGILYVDPRARSSGITPSNRLMEVSRIDPADALVHNGRSILPGKDFDSKTTRLRVVLPRDADLSAIRPGADALHSGYNGIDRGWNRVISVEFEPAPIAAVTPPPTPGTTTGWRTA